MLEYKDYIILIFTFFIVMLLCVISTDAAEVSISTGQDTIIHSINHTNGGDSYAMKEIALRLDSNWEFSIVNHEYSIQGIDDFNTVSFGIIKHWTWEHKWLYVDLGLGFRYAEKDKRIKWLRHKHLVADFSGSTGIQYKCLKFGYTLRHFSCPGSDTGMNIDEITLTFNYQF